MTNFTDIRHNFACKEMKQVIGAGIISLDNTPTGRFFANLFLESVLRRLNFVQEYNLNVILANLFTSSMAISGVTMDLLY